MFSKNFALQIAVLVFLFLTACSSTTDIGSNASTVASTQALFVESSQVAQSTIEDIDTMSSSGTSTSETSTSEISSQEITNTEGSSIVQEQTDTIGTDAVVINTTGTNTVGSQTAGIGTVANTIAQDKESLIATYAGKFVQMTYTDDETGLSITYNLYLPEGYTDTMQYPMVVFIADASCAGKEATMSLSQGRGALVWATNEWQSVHPTVVAVPTYPEVILDDNDGHTTTEYVELTRRFIDYMSTEYAIDTSRIYGTGQSMGCMTTLILASRYPDLYAGCMFVDGQWDASTLLGLANQKFVYFAAEDDVKATTGMQELITVFDTNAYSYKYDIWDGNWTTDELTDATSKLFTTDENQYFISWLSGTVIPANKAHMASFDYAYNCIAVLEWLFEE